MPPRILTQIIRELGEEHHWQVTGYSGDWHFEVRDGDRSTRIYAYTFAINPASSQSIAHDKVATSDVLGGAGIPQVAHRLVTRPQLVDWAPPEGSFARAHAIATELGYPVVAKASRGHSGNRVYRATTPAELDAALEGIFSTDRDAAVCRFYDYEREYRCVVLDGEVRLAYRKARAPGTWKHNLAHGAHPELVEPTGDLEALALRAAAALGLRFCSVDVVPFEGTWLVLEVNAGVMVQKLLETHPNLYDRIKAIYRDALQASLGKD